MNKIVHSVVIFLIFKIDWKKLIPIGAIITITFALFQSKTLPYQLTSPSSSHPDTNTFDINLKSQITPLTINEQPEVIKIDPETAILNSSSQLVQSIAVVQDKVKVTATRNQADINKPNKSVQPLSFSSASERRRKRYLRDIKALSPYEALVYAKKELETISAGVDYHDPNLYVPLFRNITVFERSYELMELIMKVYVYQDGKRKKTMSTGINFGRGYDNRQYDWDTSPQYIRRDPVITYDVPHSHNGHLGYDENRIVFEEERPVASYYPQHVVFEEQYSVPVHKNHQHNSMGPRKQVHFVGHEEKVTESFDSYGNRKVYKESVDSEADGFIKRKHKNFESSKTGAFDSFY